MTPTIPAQSPVVAPTVPVPSPVSAPLPVPTTSEAPTILEPTSSPAPTPEVSVAPTLAPSSSLAPTSGASLAVSEAPATMSFSSGPTAVSSTSEFDTTLGLDQVPDRFQSSFSEAARIWDTVIVGDMPELIVDSTVLSSPNLLCDPSTLPAVIDDIYICASVKPIDGPFGVLGSGVRNCFSLCSIAYLCVSLSLKVSDEFAFLFSIKGPNLVRVGETITVTVGAMNFDEADMDLQLAAGTLEGLIVSQPKICCISLLQFSIH